MLITLLVPLLLNAGSWSPEGDEEAARAALQQASQVRRESRGKEGEEKVTILERAVAAYERVAAEHQAVAPVCAEAWFRAGEIYRVLRQLEEAERCFGEAAVMHQVPPFGARAQNELGHLYRRTKRYPEALEAYAKVARVFPDQRLEGARALTWQGKVKVLQGRTEEGHTTLLKVGERYPEFPVEHIRNVDVVAVAWLKAERADEARRLVDECWQRHGEPAEGEAEIAADVRRALDRMRSREILGEIARSS